MMKAMPIVAVVLLSELVAAFPAPFTIPRPTAQEGRTLLHEHHHHARFRSSASMTMDVTGDPEFLDSEVNEDYDNDFDAHAFDALAYSCVVSYNNNGLASPYVSSFDSESTWVDYGEEGEVCAPAGIVGQLKETIANYLREPIVEVAISASVLISCCLVAIDTVEGIPYKSQLRVAENFISAVFAVDFFGRWFSSSKDFGRHVLDPQFALDVVVVLIPLAFGFIPDSIDASTLPLPTWMTSPSTLVNLKLIRVLRLQRVLQDMETFNKFERALGITNSGVKPWQLQLGRVLLSLFTLLSVSSGLIYAAEHEVNPCFANYFSALYFGLITLSTVGLGDIVPLTAQGKLVVCGTVILGVAVVPAQAGALVEALIQAKEGNKPPPKSNRLLTGRKTVNGDASDGQMVLETAFLCPSCGASMHWNSANYCWSCGEKL